jgi:hypothetical protein
MAAAWSRMRAVSRQHRLRVAVGTRLFMHLCLTGKSYVYTDALRNLGITYHSHRDSELCVPCIS